MTRLLLWALLLLALGSLLGYLMRTDPGYILLAWDRFALETSLWVGVIALLAVLFVIALLRILWRGVLSLKPNWRRRGVRQLEQGILAFLELRLGRAKRLLRRGEAHSPLPWINQLLLARIAQAEEDHPTVANWLEKATREHPHLELPSGLLLVLSAYESHQLDLALAHCKRLEQNHPNNPFVVRLLRDIYMQLKDWSALLELQPRLIKAGRRKPEPWQIEMIQGWVASAHPDCVARLNQWWQQLTTAQQGDQELRYQYALAITQSNPSGGAEQLLERFLKQAFDSRLLVLYSSLNTPAKRRLQFAEKLAQQQTLDANVLLGLGRLCLQESLWGKAQDYFATGVAMSDRPELTLELARLEHALGQTQSSEKRLIQLAQNQIELPQLPLPKPRLSVSDSIEEPASIVGARQV